MRLLGRIIAVVGALALLIVGYGYIEATATPRVVHYTVKSARWTGAPIVIALISDTHAALPDMPPERLARVAAQIGALRPDLIVLAGDFTGRLHNRTGAVSPQGATRPFAAMRAPLGVFAVLGNHDMGYDITKQPELAAAVERGLSTSGVRVLRNRAVRVGALWIAGTDDPDFGQADITRALADVPARAPVVMVFHNPDLLAGVPNARVALALAGHTHGGQVAPFGYALVLPMVHRNWARGLVWNQGTPMVVTSGVGVSHWPARIGVPPEIALIRLEGSTRSAGTPAR